MPRLFIITGVLVMTMFLSLRTTNLAEVNFMKMNMADDGFVFLEVKQICSHYWTLSAALASI